MINLKSLIPPLIGLILLIGCGTEPTPVYTLNTSVNGDGQIGYSVGDMEKITISSGEEQFDKEESVTLTALPDSGWVFSSWGGDASGNDLTTTITVDNEKFVRAVFNKSPNLKFEYNIHSSIPDDYETAIKDIISNLEIIAPVEEFVGWFGQSITGVAVYSWLQDKVDYPYSNEIGRTEQCICGDVEGKLVMSLMQEEQWLSESNMHRFALIAHEYFHVYQISHSRQMMSPIWMVEGQAATIEALYLKEFFNDSDYIENFINNVDYVNAIENIETYEVYESLYDSFGKYGDITLFMNLVLTKILQSNGHTEIESFKKVFSTFWLERKRASDGNHYWRADFEATFGLEVDTFYQALTQYIDDPLAVLPSNQLELSSFLELSK